MKSRLLNSRLRWLIFDKYAYVRLGVVFLIGIAALVFFISGFTVIIRYIAHHFDVNSCQTFAQASGHETKFVDYNFFEWDCLVRTRNGKWVPRDSTIEVNNG